MKKEKKRMKNTPPGVYADGTPETVMEQLEDVGETCCMVVDIMLRPIVAWHNPVTKIYQQQKQHQQHQQQKQ